MSEGGHMVIDGRAYGRRATLEVCADTLTWRAKLGKVQPTAENIVTTIHDVRDLHWIDQRSSIPGAVLAGAGVVWTITHGIVWGISAIVTGVALFVWRRTRPRQFLILDVGDRRLVLRVALPSADSARTLAARFGRVRESGEQPATPPTLP